MNDPAIALVRKLNVTPEDNQTRIALAQPADAQHQKLTVLHSVAFDTAMSTAKWHLKRPLVASKTLIPEA